MRQTLIQPPLLEIASITPNPAFPYKAVKGDKLTVTVAIRTNEQHSNIIAELWTNLDEKNKDHYHAQKLKFIKHDNNVLIYLKHLTI